MSDSVVQQIKDKLDIVEVVSGYIKLEKTGINMRANCPFHGEKKPSFFVSPTRQSFKCFGCSKGGDVFTFVQEIEGIEFKDALKILAKKAGVALPTFNPEMQTKRQRLHELIELATCFFEKQLTAGKVGKQAREYLLKRGLKPATIKKFRLGYSPDKWRALSDFLVSRGYDREEILSAGLAVKSDKAKTPYDRFRGRIIFPVFDLNSQVIGFGGRVFGQQDETAKYLNIPNTLLYDKSQVLYGLNFGKMAIRQNDFCILTEGYMDVIMSHQAGYENTVASSGTALTPFQLKILKRYTSNVLTAFDMDKAGDMATNRGIDLAQNQDFEVKVITMPAEQDPADVILSNPKKWKKMVDDATEIMDFYFQSALKKFDSKTPKGKKEISKLFLPRVKQLPNKILQAHWAQKFAGAIKTTEEAVFEELKKIARKVPEKSYEPQVSFASGKPEQTSSQPKQRKELLEEKLITLILKNGDNLKLIEDNFFTALSPKAEKVLSCLKKTGISKTDDLNKALKKVEKQDLSAKKLLEECFLRSDFEETEDKESQEQEIELCMTEIKDLDKKNKLEIISQQIKTAEQASDEVLLQNLMQKFNQLLKYDA